MFTCSERFSRQRLPLLLCSALLLCTSMRVNAIAADIRVFTDRNHSIEASSDVSIVHLDAPARIESELAAALPGDPAQAASVVQERLRRGGADLQRRLARAYQGVTDAWGLGITKIPAVVVDRRYVIYGEPNVARALARIEDYRRTER